MEPLPLAYEDDVAAQFRAHRDFQDDFKVGRTMIASLLETIEIFEPFERVRTALRIIHEQQDRAKKT
jgi:hypothetical protein